MSEKKETGYSSRILSIAILVLFLAVVAVNALANILPINGVGTGQLSDELPNLFVPAGITFSIWGLIYLLLLGYCIRLLVQAFRDRGTTPSGKADALLICANFVANACWIFAWHYRKIGLSLALMLILLSTLIWLEERGAARSRAQSRERASTGGKGARLAALLETTPINVYLGWICVATIANATALLVSAGWDGFGFDPRAWAVAAIIAASAVGLLLVFLRRAIAAPLVIVWAFAGIVLKRCSVDAEYSAPIWIAAIIGGALILIAITARAIIMRGKAG